MKRILKIFFLIIFAVAAIVLFLRNFFPLKEINQQKAQISDIIVLSESEKKLKSLSLEQKIGQLFIIGFEGKYFNSDIEGLIRELHPGGILLLKRNIESPNQLKALISALQKTALKDTGLPLFIAVDQEGGLISRLDWAEKTPQSDINNTEQAYKIGEKRGGGLKELGINLNLAPLLDETVKGDFIYGRSFQKNKEIIGELAKSLILGQKKSGIFSTIKHFPGYGRIFFNPEEKLAVIDKTPDFSQFKKAMEASPEMVMVSNVIYRDLDDRFPFSFSAEGIDFLKQNIAGDYLIILDDLDQNSLLNSFSLKEIVVLPFNAGNDILIFSGWRLPVIDGVVAFKKAVEGNEISLERIDQSVLKIINLKNKITN